MGRNTLGIAQSFLRQYVRAGDTCIDATAGKGRDTAFLCALTGENGRVLAFDIQTEAIRETRALLEQKQLRAELIVDSHANMERYCAPETVRAVVFNFGRLPGGDRHIFTQAQSSIYAVNAALRLLAPGGVMCLSVYYGGPNGYEERDALLAWAKELDDRQYSVLLCDWVNRPNEPPLTILVWKER